MRYDRFCAYCEEINLDMEKPLVRVIPHLPEEKELENLLREEYAKNKGMKKYGR
ncbi:MAG: hypothetical protein IKD10_00400 [Lentisphaeria bacterium]|nr:hypothetical protein [Lentisphaeria bacterium]